MSNNYTSCCNRIDFVVIPTYIECPCIQKTYSINEIVEDFDVFHRIFFSKCAQYHVKSVQIRRFFWFVFSCIRTEYGDLWSKSPYSVRIQESTDQKKLRIWTLFTQCKSSVICILVEVIADCCSK